MIRVFIVSFFTALTAFASGPSYVSIQDVKNITVTSSMKFRTWSQSGKTATSGTAYTDRHSQTSCTLSVSLKNGNMKNSFNLVSVKSNNEVEVYSAQKNIDLKVVSSKSQNETKLECLSGHNDICAEEETTTKYVSLDLVDSDNNSWSMFCTSESQPASWTSEPDMWAVDISFDGKGLDFN